MKRKTRIILLIVCIVFVLLGLITILIEGFTFTTDKNNKVETTDKNNKVETTDKNNKVTTTDKNNKVTTTDKGLLGETKDLMIKLHNKVRAKNGATPLKWNNDLALGAQKWVDYLKNTEGCIMRHPTSSQLERNTYLNNDTWGQNIALFKGTNGSPDECFKGWVTDECKKYNPSNPSDETKGHVGHYTQIVWKGTTEVGCAKSSCGNETLWACNYNPAGNVYFGGGNKFKFYNENVENNC